MENSWEFLALLVVLLLVVGPILAIAAFVRVRKLSQASGEIPQVLGRLYSLEQRLARVEQDLAKPAGVSPAPKDAPVPAPPGAAFPKPEPPRVAPAVPVPPRPAVSPPPPAAARAGGPSQTDGAKFEALVAGRWLLYVGIVALLFAVAYFLKYAFENNWIGPRGRVGIGLLIGSALFPLSHRILDRGYKYFSETIAGLGTAVLYLSLWAGWHYYQVFPQSAAFAMMIVVTAATAAIAIGRNSERIALLALLGGVITPLLVSTGKDQEIILFSYLAVLGAGMLGISRARDWKTLPPVQFAASLIYFWGWYATFYREPALGKTIFFATLFFLLFAALPAVRSRQEGELSILEAIIVLANAGNYLIVLRVLLWPEHRWPLTLAVLALAAAHLAAERVLPRKSGPGARIAPVLFAGLALTFVTLVIPIRLDGKWITIAWAVEGAVLIWSGLRIRVAGLRVVGLLLFLVVAGRLALISIPAGTFLLNARFAVFAVSVICGLLACYFARTSEIELSKQESVAFAATAIAANVGALVALSLEVWDVFDRMPSLGIDRGLAQQLALSALWLVYALGLIIAGVRKKSAPLRWQALALLGIVIGKVFLFDLSSLDRFYRIVSFLLLGLVLILISFFYQKRLGEGKGVKRP